jgi:putative tricarboxylic transport membrane protein
MATSLLKNGDLVSGAVLAGLGVFIVFEARKWEYLTPDGPGPGFFPMWYGLALVVLSLGVAARALATRGRDGDGAIDWSRVGRALLAWGALTVCIASLKFLGFIVSFALLTFFVVWFMYGRSVAFAAASAVAAAAAFYVIFPLALNVALPVGFLGF